MDFAKTKTADIWCIRNDLRDHNDYLIADAKFNYDAGLEAQAWRGQNCDDDRAMRLSNGVRGEQGIKDKHIKCVRLVGRQMC